MRRPCDTCIHAVLVPPTGLHCGRSGARYHCEDERSLGIVAAKIYGACGAQGRFHQRADLAWSQRRLPVGLAVEP